MSNPKFKCAWICGDGFDTLDEHNEHRRIMHKLPPITPSVPLKSERVPTEAAKPQGFNCPECGEPLKKITYPSNSMLNRDQWESVQAGDYFCTCHNNYRGDKPYAYFWKRELVKLMAAKERKPLVNSESETVEERAKSTAELLDIFLAKKYGSVEKSPIEVIEALGNVEAYEFAEFVASSLLQEKEQSYKDEREAQREFYLPANPTAEDISQARAIIAQQKSQLLEKEQRVKELGKDNFELESVVYCLRQRLC